MWAAVTLLFAASAASAQETPAQLVAKLGSRNYPERERAAKALEQIGKPAMAALREAAGSAELETKRRAIFVLERIEDRVIADELTTPTKLRLNFRDLPIDQALKTAETQMNLRLVGINRKERISLDTGAVPYWQAWQRLCAAAQLEETDYARSAAKLKRITEADRETLFRALGGSQVEVFPFIGLPIGFAAQPDLRPYAADDRHSVRVRARWHGVDKSIDGKTPHAVFAFELRAEPRLEIATLPSVEITKIVDERGDSRAVRTLRVMPEGVQAKDATFLAAYAGEIQFTGLLHLKAIPWPDETRALKELHGRVRIDVTARPRLLEFPNVLKAAGKTDKSYQGITVKVLAAEIGDEGEIRVRLHVDNIDSLTPQTQEQAVVRVRPGVVALRGAMDVAIERLELLDGLGRRSPLIRSKYEKADKGTGYDADLTFAYTGARTDELTLVLTKAPRTVVVEMPFLVRDLALPEMAEGK
jgi:hypothetical protein